MKLDNSYQLEYLDNMFNLHCYIQIILPYPLRQVFSRTSGTVDKTFGWKVLLSEIIWRLQVQSQLQIRITRNTYYCLILVMESKQSTPWIK